MENEKKTIKENMGNLKISTFFQYFLYTLTTLGIIYGGYQAILTFIDKRIEEKINNIEFQKKLARSVRPSLVFDEKESIIADMGAVSFINKIIVSKISKNNFKIIVSPNEYLSVEPVLESLDGVFVILAERGQKFDWIFKLEGINILVNGSPTTQRNEERFRLEIIR